MLPLLPEERPHDRSWDTFTARRTFARAAQNQSYVEFLWLQAKEQPEAEVEEDEDRDGEESDHEDFIDVDDEEGEDGRDASERTAASLSEKTGNDILMLALDGEDGTNNTGYDPQVIKSVCWADEPLGLEKQLERDGRGRIVACTFNITAGNHVQYRGKLKASELLGELRQPRFVGEGTASLPISQYDIERRRLYFANPTGRGILTLLATATRLQIPHLRDFIHRHVRGKANIGLTISPQGFKTYAFYLHLPFPALRWMKSCPKDKREKPLRQWRRLEFAETDPSQGILVAYEAQISLLVYGFDEWRYDAVLFADDVFDTDLSVKEYHNYSPFADDKKRVDPLLKRKTPVGETVHYRSPKYFVQGLLVWLDHAERQWQKNVDILWSIMRQNRWNDTPASSETPRPDMKSRAAWAEGMGKHLREMKNSLELTVLSCGNFLKIHSGVFTGDDKVDLGTIPERLSKLGLVVKQLDTFIEEINIEVRNALSTDLAIETNDAAKSQHRTAEFVKILTIITLSLAPVGLASNLLSTQTLPQTGVVLGVSVAGWSIIVAMILWGLLKFEMLHRFIRRILRSLRPQPSDKPTMETGESPAQDNNVASSDAGASRPDSDSSDNDYLSYSKRKPIFTFATNSLTDVEMGDISACRLGPTDSANDSIRYLGLDPLHWNTEIMPTPHD